ncbi:hypothetical protein Tco_0236617 [Tanacetum coccineum]
MVISSPCLTDIKNWLVQKLATPEQTATGKEILNPLIADSLLKTISCDEEKTKTKRHSIIWFLKEQQTDHYSREAKDLKKCLDREAFGYNPQKLKLKKLEINKRSSSLGEDC